MDAERTHADRMHAAWTREDAIDIAAAPERVWRLFADVPCWPRWNAGVETLARLFAIAVCRAMLPRIAVRLV